MKKRIFAFCLAALFAVVCFAGCAGNTNEVEETPEDTANETVSDAQDYGSVLDMYYGIIQNAASMELVDGKIGVIETAQYLGDAALSSIGYLYKDINGDGVSELLIGRSSADGYVKNELFAVYTFMGGQPTFVTEGRSRSSYALMENGALFYEGSNGASYSIFGTYTLSEDAMLVCNDFYFSYDKSSWEDIGFFHNTTGVYEKSAAEELNIDSDAFFGIAEGLADKTAVLDFTPFAAYTPSDDSAIEAVPEKPAAPAFIGNWKGTARGYDGTNYALFVELLEDGTGVYKCGPVESEIMVDCRGTWSTGADGETIVLSLTDRYEGFAFNGEYKWSVNSGLELLHVGGDAFLYGAEGKNFSFSKE